MTLFCSGYCEHGKFMGECSDCAHAMWCDTVGRPRGGHTMTLPDEALQAAVKVYQNPPKFDERSFEEWDRDMVNSILNTALAALGGRVVVEKPCEHGYVFQHGLSYSKQTQCSDGERIVIWEGEEQ